LDLENYNQKQEKTRSTSPTIAMFFCKEIYQSFGKYWFQIDRDHATVLHACKTVDNLVTDKQFKNLLRISIKINVVKAHAAENFNVWEYLPFSIGRRYFSFKLPKTNSQLIQQELVLGTLAIT
jgi:hypothetical protein